jgi:hypothetical protein
VKTGIIDLDRLCMIESRLDWASKQDSSLLTLTVRESPFIAVCISLQDGTSTTQLALIPKPTIPEYEVLELT